MVFDVGQIDQRSLVFGQFETPTVGVNTVGKPLRLNLYRPSFEGFARDTMEIEVRADIVEGVNRIIGWCDQALVQLFQPLSGGGR